MLAGRTVVNLTADTPERARSTAAWAAGHGIGYLDGAIMTPAATVGTAGAVFPHSGPPSLYREHRPVLDALGGTHTHLGAEIGRAAAYDIALLDIFWTGMGGYAHGLAVAHIIRTSEAHGIDASVMRAVEGLARRVIGRGHGTDGFLRVTELLRERSGRGVPVGGAQG